MRAEHRRRRRARLAVAGVVAAVVVGAGVPLTAGLLTSSSAPPPGEGAGPAPASSPAGGDPAPTVAPTVTPPVTPPVTPGGGVRAQESRAADLAASAAAAGRLPELHGGYLAVHSCLTAAGFGRAHRPGGTPSWPPAARAGSPTPASPGTSSPARPAPACSPRVEDRQAVGGASRAPVRRPGAAAEGAAGRSAAPGL